MYNNNKYMMLLKLFMHYYILYIYCNHNNKELGHKNYLYHII